jgi:LuxR family maltose regulon positive regulatory protein
MAGVLPSPKRRDRGDSMISSRATRREGQLDPPISKDVSVARGLLDREALLQTLDRAVTRRITVISAPAGSGKTSLLRTWAERSTDVRRVAFVSVDRDKQDAQRFWSAVLDALRSPAASIDPEMQRAALAGVDGDRLVDMVRSELDQADLLEPVVLIVDDLHELRSAEALAQLERLLAVLPSSARVVLSSRRDPPIRLHQLRLAYKVAEIRAVDLRFTEREARELLAGSRISLSEGGVAALYERTEGWAAGLRLAAISLADHADPERFVAEFSGTNRAIGEYLMAEMLEPSRAMCSACCWERHLSTA